MYVNQSNDPNRPAPDPALRMMVNSRSRLPPPAVASHATFAALATMASTRSTHSVSLGKVALPDILHHSDFVTVG